MGIKLIKPLCLILVIGFTSCTAIQKFKKSDFYISYDDYKKSYNTAFICSCINESTNNNLNKFIADNNDAGLFTESELITPSKVMEADSLGRLYAKKIVAINYADANFKKPIISRCIWFSLSKDVDTIIRKSYKKNYLKK